MGRVLADTEPLTHGPDPIANARALSLALFDQFVRLPWSAQFMLRNSGLQPNSMSMFDRLGQQLMRLDLTRGSASTPCRRSSATSS